VALETPPCFFPEHVQAAVEAGLHVFMAKPVAIDVPGCRQVEAAAKKAAEQPAVLPGGLPDAHRSARDRVRRALPGRGAGDAEHGEELLLRRAVRRSAADRHDREPLRSLVWVNDTAIGGCYHVNACIHPIQAMMWVLDKVPVAAAGISSTRRANPHGDSHDMFGITYEFDDGLLWTHTGRHAKGLTGPDDPLATCEFLGDAYMKIGYGGRALIRGGSHHYPGESIENLYAPGPSATSPRSIRTSSRATWPTRPSAWRSTVAWPRSWPAKPACARATMTMDELLKENRRIEPDLTGLKALTIFPVHVHNEASGEDHTCRSDDDLREALQQIFASLQVRRVISALLREANSLTSSIG
jgi:myo-inositol 2-dehydrogenase / D-chiro-inositol 1-dehydrogenase